MLNSKRAQWIERKFVDIRAGLNMISPNDWCQFDFVGTLVRVKTRFPQTSLCWQLWMRGRWIIKPESVIVATVTRQWNGEHWTRAMLYDVLTAGVGRRELFDPENPPKMRKTRSDVGKAHIFKLALKKV